MYGSKLKGFTELSRTENLLDYNGKKFTLSEKRVGVYGLGKCINLHSMDPSTLEKKYIVTVGWIEGDGHSSGNSNASLLSGIDNTWLKCKIAAVDYLEKLYRGNM